MVRPGPVVKRGTWLYDGLIPCGVSIVRGNVIYGSGDLEDPPEEYQDREVECFCVLYEGPHGAAQAKGGVYMSLDEAIVHVEHTVGASLRWKQDAESNSRPAASANGETTFE
jgi:hypothetical protein